MKLLESAGFSIEMIDLAVFIRFAKKNLSFLVIADPHLGYEDYLHKQGILIQRFQFKEMLKRLQNIFSKIKKRYDIESLDAIIINGDLKHEFGTISEQEWRETLGFLDFLSGHANKTIIVKGNHDTIVGPIAEKRNVEFVENYKIREILITHGHKLPLNRELKNSEIIIIGHEHPAVQITCGVRRELFKSLLVGKWHLKTLIVMPSLCLVTEGTDVQKEELMSPFLKGGVKINSFRTFIISEEGIYDFGTLGNINAISPDS